MGRNKSCYYKWYDEPDHISVKLQEGYLQVLTVRAIKRAGSVAELSSIMKISKATIFNYKNEKHLNVNGLKTLLRYLDIQYDRINHRITRMGWNQHKLHIKLDSTEIALILAASLADGHLSKSHFMYKNKNIALINRVENNVRKIFGKDVKITHKVDRHGTPYMLCSSFVKRQLVQLGSPQGKKLFSNPGIPSIILNGNLDAKRIFIQQFFDDEGWAETGNTKVACCQNADTTSVLSEEFIKQMEIGKEISIGKIRPEIRAQIVKPNLLVDILILLKQDFDIQGALRLKRITKRKSYYGNIYVSATWEFEIIQKKEFKKFYDKIGFYSKVKQENLKDMVMERPLPNNMECRLLNTAIKLKKTQGSFRVKDIQKEIHINRGKIRKRLSTLVGKGILSNKEGEYGLNLEV